MNFVHCYPNYCISLVITFHNLISVTTITKKSIRDLLYNFCTRFLSLMIPITTTEFIFS